MLNKLNGKQFTKRAQFKSLGFTIQANGYICWNIASLDINFIHRTKNSNEMKKFSHESHLFGWNNLPKGRKHIENKIKSANNII